VSQQETISVRNLAIGIATGFGIIIAFIVAVLLISQLGTDDHYDEPEALRYERIKPVGQINLGEIEGVVAEAPTSEAPAVEQAPVLKSGQEVYEAVCQVCHATALLPNTPKFADQATWADRITKGESTLIQNAIKGFNTMPPRGGHSSLTDEEVKRAVQYMLAAIEATPTIAEKMTPSPITESTVLESTPPPIATAPDLAKGEEVYNSACGLCHTMGIAGAPKLEDKENWTPRITQGMETLFDHALQGFQGKAGVMPPKGGQMHLSDGDVKAAVTYMVAKVEPPKAEVSTTEAVSNQATETATSEAESVQGEPVYNQSCALCHTMGIAGAPKLGDKENWTSRIAQGIETLLDHALRGFQGKTGVMPPKGGQMHLSDEEVKAAVAYMVSKAQ